MKKIDRIINSVSKISTKEIKTKHNVQDFFGKKILTVGTYDLLHIGHKKIIDHALEIAMKPSNLVIAVSSDRWNNLKGKSSVEIEEVRIKNIKEAYPGSIVILEDHDAPEQSWPKIFDEYNIDLIVMGGDHVETLSYINDIETPNGREMRIAFFERTPKISSTLIRESINKF